MIGYMTLLLNDIRFDKFLLCLRKDLLVKPYIRVLIIVNGHYLSAEADFLERRRRGLNRFMNSIVRHPVLRDDDIVVAFITVPTVLQLDIELTSGTFSLAQISINSSRRRIHRP